MMLTDRGHLKIIDFGTAKDLIEKDLNGPEFVGTPEYMSPQTLKSKDVGIEADLWSLGVIVYQIFSGYTPFAAASPYLSFLRIKRALLLKLPLALPPFLLHLLELLLDLDPQRRLENAMGPTNELVGGSISYDRLRSHAFFTPLSSDLPIQSSDTIDQVQMLKAVSYVPAVTVPRLSELCIRAVARASLDVAEKLAENGGLRPVISMISIICFDVFVLMFSQPLIHVGYYLGQKV
jgi:serine/threonine protein kinase